MRSRFGQVTDVGVWASKTLLRQFGVSLPGPKSSHRLKIVPEGEAKPLFCDLYDRTAGVLIEAKGTVTRNAIRMAIGQLAGYQRLVDPTPRLPLLVPEEPRADLKALLEAEGIEIISQTNAGFDHAALRCVPCAAKPKFPGGAG